MRIRPLTLFIFLIGLYAGLSPAQLSPLLSLPLQITAAEAAETSENVEPLDYHKRYRHIDAQTGLRTAYYRAALPPSVPGGKRIDVKAAYAHFTAGDALFLDVMAHTGTGPDPIDGHWRLSEPRESIPGSHWLADVGTGTLSEELQNYLASNLAKLTNGNKQQPIIIYCTADCWMAWNAVQRVAKLGYTNLLWFPEGTDDWQAAGYPLTNTTPIPLEISD